MGLQSVFQWHCTTDRTNVQHIIHFCAPSALQDDDEDLQDYINSLREAVLQAWTGIIQGWNTDEGKKKSG